MSTEHRASRSTLNQSEVFRIGVISPEINKAVKNAVYKEKIYPKKEDIEDIDDADCIIVIDKKNRHSILLTSEPMKAMDNLKEHSAKSPTMCYARDEHGLVWLTVCKQTSDGSVIASFKVCVSKACPSHAPVHIEGPCPCPVPPE